jgi:hypothetical protein
LRGPPAQQRPQKKPKSAAGWRLGAPRTKPPGAPQSAKRERGQRRGKRPRGRMSTQADSRKHSLGHKARGPVADGWRATHRTSTATPRMHAQARLTETRWEWPSTRPRSQAHGKTIAVRGIANQWSRRARPATCKAEGRVVVAMPSGPGMAEGDNLRRSKNAHSFPSRGQVTVPLTTGRAGGDHLRLSTKGNARKFSQMPILPGNCRGTTEGG